MESLSPEVEHYLREEIGKGISHKEISKRLQEILPGQRGVSKRSVRRFCSKYNIHRTSRLQKDPLRRVIASKIGQVSIILVEYYVQSS